MSEPLAIPVAPLSEEEPAEPLSLHKFTAPADDAGAHGPRWPFIVFALVAGAAVTGAFFLRPQPVLLCGRLLQSDTERVCAVLDELKVRYAVKHNGSAVYVAKPKVHAARLELARRFLASERPVTFDVVNATGRASTKGYCAALQQELEATLAHMEGVDFARVLIEVPGNRGRLNGERPFAVVIVHTTRNARLTPERAQVIQSLVASSSDWLRFERVSVTECPDYKSFAHSEYNHYETKN